MAFSCDFGNGVEAGTETGAGAGGEGVLGAIVLCIFRGCSIGGVLLLGGAGGSSFGVDARRIFFFFFETTSFHSPGGERSVVVSRSAAEVGVLGLSSCGALLASIVGDGVKHTASLKEAAKLGGVGAAILGPAILTRASSCFVADILLVGFL